MPRTTILLYNTGYLTGLDGSMRDYVLRSMRYLYTPQRVWKKLLASLDDLLDRENPDICCFPEVRRINRFIRQFHDYAFRVFENKYGMRSVFRHLPYFRHNCIGVLSHHKFPVHKHFFSRGVKRLFYEVKLNSDTSLFFSHLALRKRARCAQLKELEEMVARRKRVIVCGDFNIFSGVQELEEFIERCALRMVNSLNDFTFPAIHPQKSLDLFLCSQDLEVEDLKVLHSSQPVSDHLPVLLTLRI